MVTVNGTTGVSMVQDDAVNPVTDIASGIPCFSAYQSVAHSIGTAYTKINFQTKEFDTTSAFDNVTNMRFNPQVAGYYQVNGSSQMIGASVYSSCAIYKNNILAKHSNFIVVTGTNPISSVSAIIFLNGTTDYIELFAWHSTTANTGAVADKTYFQAHLIVGA